MMPIHFISTSASLKLEICLNGVQYAFHYSLQAYYYGIISRGHTSKLNIDIYGADSIKIFPFSKLFYLAPQAELNLNYFMPAYIQMLAITINIRLRIRNLIPSVCS